eukprot:30147-Pelagococcus_subviridis.AAC.2
MLAAATHSRRRAAASDHLARPSVARVARVRRVDAAAARARSASRAPRAAVGARPSDGRASGKRISQVVVVRDARG